MKENGCEPFAFCRRKVSGAFSASALLSAPLALCWHPVWDAKTTEKVSCFFVTISWESWSLTNVRVVKYRMLRCTLIIAKMTIAAHWVIE